MSLIWSNRGSLMPIPALDDRGFSFGMRVMTTIAWRKGIYVDFDRHLARLKRHAEMSGIPDNLLSSEEIKFELDACRQSAGNSDVYACRVFLTAGPGALRAPIAAPQRWVSVEAYVETEQAPLNLMCVADGSRKRGEHAKTGLYNEASTYLTRASKSNFNDLLWVNGDSEVTEAAAGNVFFIGREGDLVEIATPAISSGLLSGVTRSRIAELLNNAKIPVTERIIYKDEIPRFDEAFMTSSLGGIRPISRIDAHKLHSTREKSVVGHVMRLWNAWLQSLELLA